MTLRVWLPRSGIWVKAQRRRLVVRLEDARRIAAVERGESRLIPGDDVDARLRAIVGRV